MLKDGGLSFVRPSEELGYDEEDCIIHKLCPPNHKTYTKKKFSSKSSNHRGSIYRFLESKKVLVKDREYIAYCLWCLNAVFTSNDVYSHAVHLFIKQICIVFMDSVEKHDVIDNS